MDEVYELGGRSDAADEPARVVSETVFTGAALEPVDPTTGEDEDLRDAPLSGSAAATR